MPLAFLRTFSLLREITRSSTAHRGTLFNGLVSVGVAVSRTGGQTTVVTRSSRGGVGVAAMVRCTLDSGVGFWRCCAAESTLGVPTQAMKTPMLRKTKPPTAVSLSSSVGPSELMGLCLRGSQSFSVFPTTRLFRRRASTNRLTVCPTEERQGQVGQVKLAFSSLVLQLEASMPSSVPALPPLQGFFRC